VLHDEPGNFRNIRGKYALFRGQITRQRHQWRGQNAVGITDRDPDTDLTDIDTKPGASDKSH
jgi:hypothetical protein